MYPANINMPSPPMIISHLHALHFDYFHIQIHMHMHMHF